MDPDRQPARGRTAVALVVALVASGCGDDLAPAAAVDAAVDAAVGGDDAGAIAFGPLDPPWPPDVLPAAFDFPPWLTLPAAGQVAVGWRSVRPSTGWVEVVASPDGALEVDWSAARRFASPGRPGDHGEAPPHVHHVRLADLDPATAYRYRVHLLDEGGEAVREGVFVTPGARTLRFAHLAEFHAPSDADRVAAFADTVRGFRPHLLIESGDMVDAGDELANWRSYLVTSSPWISNAFILPAHSNHVNGSLGNGYLRMLFELPDNERWYSTRFGPIEIVTLDSTSTLNPDTATEPDFVRARLADVYGGAIPGGGAGEAPLGEPPRRLIAAWHYPACSSHYAGRTRSRRDVIDQLVPAFTASGGPDLILVGHDKYYERSVLEVGGVAITHVMANIGKLAPSTAGGNEPECSTRATELERNSIGLYRVHGASIQASVVDEAGDEIDRFSLPPRRPRPSEGSPPPPP